MKNNIQKYCRHAPFILIPYILLRHTPVSLIKLLLFFHSTRRPLTCALLILRNTIDKSLISLIIERICLNNFPCLVVKATINVRTIKRTLLILLLSPHQLFSQLPPTIPSTSQPFVTKRPSILHQDNRGISPLEMTLRPPNFQSRDATTKKLVPRDLLQRLSLIYRTLPLETYRRPTVPMRIDDIAARLSQRASAAASKATVPTVPPTTVSTPPTIPAPTVPSLIALPKLPFPFALSSGMPPVSHRPVNQEPNQVPDRPHTVPARVTVPTTVPGFLPRPGATLGIQMHPQRQTPLERWAFYFFRSSVLKEFQQ